MSTINTGRADSSHSTPGIWIDRAPEKSTGDPLACAREMFEVLDNLRNGDEQRKSAAKNLVALALEHPIVIRFILQKAEEYATAQEISDAHPYSPNPFTILIFIGRGVEGVINFLIHILNEGGCSSRHEAIRVLCMYGDEASDRVLRDIVLGKYPQRQSDLQNEIHLIESIKGSEFILAMLQG